jgi:hypothetical protein
MMASPPFLPHLTANDHQQLVGLLHVASSIEHSLMVQYLFAAYSLDPDQGDDDEERQMIADWQSLILSVAKEEMGHFLTVQNVLCLLGEPIDLARACPPLDEKFQPLFRLERLTAESLNRYIETEKPEGSSDAQRLAEFSSSSNKASSDALLFRKPFPVGTLYKNIIELMNSPQISDAAFNEDRFHLQASWDDWGRGHADRRPAPNAYNTSSSVRPVSLNVTNLHGFMDTFDDRDLAQIWMNRWYHFKKEPNGANVLVRPVATRQQATQALSLIAEQGENAKLDSGSHFLRFTLIARELKEAKKRSRQNPGWEPTHPIANDPHVGSTDSEKSKSEITSNYSKAWAALFNHRYCMLLNYIGHSFQLAADGPDAPLRGVLIHKAFGEMYNLKAIANILVRLPLNDSGDACNAGPPFQLPPSLILPPAAVDRWKRHRKFLCTAIELNEAIRRAQYMDECGQSALPTQTSYLRAVKTLDVSALEWTKKVIAGCSRNSNGSR